ncbi:hypothetical protein Tco_1091528 [Tanacetum coccineum]|uniref:Uncharacterized protein n=1 Tax=Tanacetum coccineum TaxID=301880 RepID=A0ABQ5I7G3_9ASTR
MSNNWGRFVRRLGTTREFTGGDRCLFDVAYIDAPTGVTTGVYVDVPAWLEVVTVKNKNMIRVFLIDDMKSPLGFELLLHYLDIYFVANIYMLYHDSKYLALYIVYHDSKISSYCNVMVDLPLILMFTDRMPILMFLASIMHAYSLQVTEVVASKSQHEQDSPKNISKKMEAQYSNVSSNNAAEDEKPHSTSRSTSTAMVVYDKDMSSTRESYGHGEWQSDLLGCCSEPEMCLKTFVFSFRQ